MSSDMLLLITGAAVAGLVQGIAGFAFGMLSMSFWVWSLSPGVAAVLAVWGSLVGQVMALFTLRRPPTWKLLWPFLGGGAIGMPLGVWVLPTLDVTAFRLFLGLLLTIGCPLMLLQAKLPPVTRGGRTADALVGALGGFMGGLGGFSGIAPSLWCGLRGWSKDEQRAVIQNFLLAAHTTTLAGYAATGLITRETLPLMPIVAAAMLVPAVLGARIYIGLSEVAFRRVVLSLLTLTGVGLLVAAVPKILARTF